ncbi:MAG: VanZ family protein [Betaproteobacteria bacterium]
MFSHPQHKYPRRTSVMRAAFWSALVVLTVLSLLPTERLPDFTASIWDKAQHALGFALLATLGLWAYPGGKRLTTQVILGLLALGVALEWAQGASGWRHADAADAAADAVGVAVGWALVSAQRRWWAL